MWHVAKSDWGNIVTYFEPDTAVISAAQSSLTCRSGHLPQFSVL